MIPELAETHPCGGSGIFLVAQYGGQRYGEVQPACQTT